MISRIYRVWKTEGAAGLFVRLGNRVRVLHSLRQNFGKSEVVSSYGVLMSKNWQDATFRFCITGAYGRFFSSYLEKQAEAFVFIDVGSNQGLYTLIANKNPKCTKIIAFEPVSSTFSLLEQNIIINDALEKCFPVQKGLGRQASSITIGIPKNHSGAATTAAHLDDASKEYMEETIEIVSSNYLNELEISDNDNIIVKIDVEGQEESVLEALAESLIFDKIQAIFYEVDEVWVDPKKLECFLTELGFKNFQRIGSGKHYDVLASRNSRDLSTHDLNE